MNNQHKQIKGYRDLSQEEVDAMNRVKAKAEEVGRLIDELQSTYSIDHRWMNIGKTDLQTGFMAVIRAIARPTSF